MEQNGATSEIDFKTDEDWLANKHSESIYLWKWTHWLFIKNFADIWAVIIHQLGRKTQIIHQTLQKKPTTTQ